MKKIALEIESISHSVTRSHNYAVVMGEIGGIRRLPIVIGGFEAQAIAVAMENLKPNRPLTHDLFANTLASFDIDLIEVIISELKEGIFFAQLVCERKGEKIYIDSRTSDAIALAVRFGCPIYTYDFILESAGVVLDAKEADVVEKPQQKEAKKQKTLADFSVAELKKMLNDVLAKEDYEKAARIRDEINRRG